MKIYVPKDTAYEPLMANLKQVHNIEENEKAWVITTEVDIIIPREWSGLAQNAFRKLGKKIRASEGAKKTTDEEVLIQILRKKIMKIRVASEEEKILNDAAKRVGKQTAEFVRETALSRATKMLESSKKARENAPQPSEEPKKC
jgi:uncharacterized protein (DUF1778 family)